MRVEIYRNLHKRCWSVRACEGPDKGRVIEHADQVAVTNPRFVVQPAGRRKVLETGSKNVHAFVRGTYGGTATGGTQQARYNPFKYETFVDSDEQPLYTAAQAFCTDDGKVWYE
jgi:hypothetical protein